MSDDTIFALSSGAPPSAIGVIRISGPDAIAAGERLAGGTLQPRRASLRSLRDESGGLLDKALVLRFDASNTATGEDIVELHCHGGRAVVTAVCDALGRIDGLRPAQAGEFTRRAFLNGRMNLTEAEGLADLLTAETELQRRAAQAMAGGAVSRQIEEWRTQLLRLSAMVEGVLNFSDEDDAAELPESFRADLDGLQRDIHVWLQRPRAERLREGVRVVLAGPPNSGKSSLFNALLEDDAAIVSDTAGTTRDMIERSVSWAGVPFVLVDTAGLREDAAEEIEAEGIARARKSLEIADIVLWLGPEGQGPSDSLEIETMIDAPNHVGKLAPVCRISARTGEGLPELQDLLARVAGKLLPKPGQTAITRRQGQHLAAVADSLTAALESSDELIVGDNMRRARVEFDALIGRSNTEDMLDTLFSGFCIGK